MGKSKGKKPKQGGNDVTGNSSSEGKTAPVSEPDKSLESPSSPTPDLSLKDLSVSDTANPPPSEAPANPQPLEAPANPQPSKATKNPQPSKAPANPPPSEAPAKPRPSEAPANPQPTEAPAKSQPLKAPAAAPPSKLKVAPANKPALVCPVCKASAASRCGGCNSVAYCSREHQKQHWKIHKNECLFWKLSESRELGRFLVATRDVKPGTVVLREKPLLLTPPRITAPVCLGCYNEFLQSDDAAADKDIQPASCPNDCGWPMCNTEACKADRTDHNEAECSIAKARGGVNIQHFGQDHPMYQSIGLLRALALREKQPEAYKQLLALQSHVKEQEAASREASEQGFSSAPPDTGMVTNLITNFFNQTKDEGLVKEIVGIMETNGHEIPLPGNYGQINRRLIGIYSSSSFLEHNCRPNCVKSWDSSTKEIIIRASVPIKKGEHYSISYVDPLWGTNDRQNFLQMTKYFTCKCERCLDPTELGCHISSIRCQQIQCTGKVEAEERAGVYGSTTGMIVPDDPLNPESSWKCLSCSEIYPVQYAASIAEKIGRDVEEFQEKRGDIGAEEEFIRKYHKVLGSSHFYLLEIKVELAQLYGRTADEPLPMLSPQKLLRKKLLCEELIRVFNVITPGYNRLRALILYEYQAAESSLSNIRHSVGEISSKTHLDVLEKCKNILGEVILVLSWEPHMSVEYRRCEGAKRELEDLKSMIEALTEVQSSQAPLFRPDIFNVPSIGGQGESTTTVNEFEDDLELF